MSPHRENSHRETLHPSAGIQQAILWRAVMAGYSKAQDLWEALARIELAAAWAESRVQRLLISQAARENVQKLAIVKTIAQLRRVPVMPEAQL